MEHKSHNILTDCPFLCLRLYKTVQFIWRGFLLDRNADSHFAFKNWKTWNIQLIFTSQLLAKQFIYMPQLSFAFTGMTFMKTF